MIRYLSAFLILLSSHAVARPTTTVESKSCHYNGSEIILHGDVAIENAMGRLTAENALLIRDEERKYSIDFPWAELTDQVTLAFPSGKLLRCQHLELDYPQMVCYFFGDPQIYYRDEMGEVLANFAVVDFQEIEGKIEPVKITLRGNVQMTNSSNKKKESPQYALADCVEYYPDQELMLFFSEAEKRVLFYDLVRDMQLSAKTVRAQRNASKKETVQGIGDVRFLFAQDELEKLKQHFHWE